MFIAIPSLQLDSLLLEVHACPVFLPAYTTPASACLVNNVSAFIRMTLRTMGNAFSPAPSVAAAAIFIGGYYFKMRRINTLPMWALRGFMANLWIVASVVYFKAMRNCSPVQHVRDAMRSFFFSIKAHSSITVPVELAAPLPATIGRHVIVLMESCKCCCSQFLKSTSRAGHYLRLLSRAFCEQRFEQYSCRLVGINGVLHSVQRFTRLISRVAESSSLTNKVRTPPMYSSRGMRPVASLRLNKRFEYSAVASARRAFVPICPEYSMLHRISN